MTFNSCEIYNNEAGEGRSGGGVFVSDGTVTFDTCITSTTTLHIMLGLGVVASELMAVT